MNRYIKNTLTTALLTLAPLMSMTSFAADSKGNTNSVSPAEKAKIEKVVREYLISKPEVLMEALQVLQQRQYEQAQQTVKNTQKTVSTFANALLHQNSDPMAGNADGAVTVVEFFDYQCPHCVDMAPVIESIIKTNPQVRIVFKEFPIRGPVSEFAARAAIAANQQHKYYEFNHALLTSSKPLSQDVILEIAKNTGLDIEQLKKDMKDSATDKQLKANAKLAQDLKLFGTPAFFIGKSDGKSAIDYIPGQIDQKQLQEKIDQVSK